MNFNNLEHRPVDTGNPDPKLSGKPVGCSEVSEVSA